GVCDKIEVITSGGEQVKYTDDRGSVKTGYSTSHLVLERGEILTETDAPYHPPIGELDGTYRPRTGTTIRMRVFDYRHVPALAVFERQMAQRFGLQSAKWKIVLQDNTKKAGENGYSCSVGEFQIEANKATKIV